MRAWALVLAGCWTSSTPPDPSKAAPPPASANASIRGIRKCAANGPQTLILEVRETDDTFDVEIPYDASERVPRTVVDSDRVLFSPCRLHGCSVATLTLDELVIGTSARGHYKVEANAGPAYTGSFVARWAGTPWAVECPRDPV